MGNVQAKNEVDAAIAVSTSIMNTTLQKCETSLSQNEDIDVEGCDFTDIEHVNFDESGTVDIRCVQKSSDSQSIKNQIDTEMTQMAKAVKQAIDANPGSATAENVDRLSEQLGTTIRNTFSQSCLPTVSGSESINVKCPATKGGTAIIKWINFKELADSTTKCTQEATSVQVVSNAIKTIIDQTAVAKEAPLISLGVVVLIIVAIILFMVMGGGKAMSIITVLAVVLIVIIITYFVLAAIFKWKPF